MDSNEREASKRIGCLEVSLESNSISVTNVVDSEVKILRLIVYYNYTVETPDRKVIKRRGREELAKNIDLGPRASFSINFDIEIIGARIVYLCNDELRDDEVIFE